MGQITILKLLLVNLFERFGGLKYEPIKGWWRVEWFA
jgi:hypothetical protein